MKLLNTESTYKMLQPFEKIEQLNANTRAIREQFADKLSPATRQVLDVLHRYASKYYGVCFLSKSKIADKLGVSKRTVIRACQRLEELGVIAQYPLYRHNGDRRQSSNAIVFVAQIEAKEAFVEQSESNVTPECHPKDAPLNAHLENINNTLDTEKADAAVKEVDKEQLIKDGLVAKLPSTLQLALAPFFSADKLYELAGVIFKAKASVDRGIYIEDYEREYYETILSVINAFKRGRAHNLNGLLYHAIKSTTRAIWHRERAYLLGVV